jgi:hypothetical protein
VTVFQTPDAVVFGYTYTGLLPTSGTLLFVTSDGSKQYGYKSVDGRKSGHFVFNIAGAQQGNVEADAEVGASEARVSFPRAASTSRSWREAQRRSTSMATTSMSADWSRCTSVAGGAMCDKARGWSSKQHASWSAPSSVVAEVVPVRCAAGAVDVPRPPGRGSAPHLLR